MGFNPSKAASSERAAKLFVREIDLDFGGGETMRVGLRLRAGQHPQMSKRVDRVGATIAQLEGVDLSTPDAEEHYNGIMADLVDDIAWALDRFLDSWDGVDDDGNPSTPDYATLASYPAESLIILFGVLLEDMQDLLPKAQKKTSGSSKPSTKSGQKRRKS